MKINSIELTDVGGTPHLNLEFLNTQMNIICGENGVGKTTLLDSIGHIFTNQYSHILKKNINSNRATINGNVTDDQGNKLNPILLFNQSKPDQGSPINGLGHLSFKLISLKVDRTFSYQKLDAITKDQTKQEGHASQQSINGIDYRDIKSWFLHRHLYSAHPEALKQEQLENFALAKRCFSILNPAFNFSRVDANDNEIMLNTPSGEIYYEYLSSGFKSTISIVFEIIMCLNNIVVNSRCNKIRNLRILYHSNFTLKS